MTQVVGTQGYFVTLCVCLEVSNYSSDFRRAVYEGHRSTHLCLVHFGWNVQVSLKVNIDGTCGMLQYV